MPLYRVTEGRPKGPQEAKLDTVLWFGKHKGKTIEAVIDDGKGKYIQWAIDNDILTLDAIGEAYLESNTDDEERYNEGDIDDSWGDR